LRACAQIAHVAIEHRERGWRAVEKGGEQALALLFERRHPARLDERRGDACEFLELADEPRRAPPRLKPDDAEDADRLARLQPERRTGIEADERRADRPAIMAVLPMLGDVADPKDAVTAHRLERNGVL